MWAFLQYFKTTLKLRDPFKKISEFNQPYVFTLRFNPISYLMFLPYVFTLCFYPIFYPMFLPYVFTLCFYPMFLPYVFNLHRYPSFPSFFWSLKSQKFKYKNGFWLLSFTKAPKCLPTFPFPIPLFQLFKNIILKAGEVIITIRDLFVNRKLSFLYLKFDFEKWFVLCHNILCKKSFKAFVIFFCKMSKIKFNSKTEVYSSFVSHLYQSGYYSYSIKVGFGLGEDACVAIALFNLCLLGCQSLRETLLQKLNNNKLVQFVTHWNIFLYHKTVKLIYKKYFYKLYRIDSRCKTIKIDFSLLLRARAQPFFS